MATTRAQAASEQDSKPSGWMGKMFQDASHVMHDTVEKVSSVTSNIDSGKFLQSIESSAKIFGEKMAPGLYVLNESSVSILFVLSEATPLHW